ncbi:sugar ABC transporter permease [Methanosarcina sp. 1.H.T.1A.1]|uniref:ABC transporter permease n=1 Tax=unclassified Methanosarcina TaxID=2644672 RepID=UPI000621918C|nr:MULTISPECIES: ABC transporter permease [unclassified Methanosarcina]KKH47060.1 sugar ABC transporter permease [Methanosarcina sp. 1.H.A.2.2]KKH91804.1 sugar ABC transporter permease [Methanosarcina sp. 1.H.T.1A.1]
MSKNLWKYRHLIKRLAISDFKVRYKNSVLGFFWSLLEPLLMLLVLYVVFVDVFPSTQKNYHLFLLLGIALWDFFTKGTSMGLQAIISKPGMVRQVYIPREILIFSSSLTALMMAVLEIGVFGIFMVISGVVPTSTAIYFPIIFMIIFILVFGTSLALGALNTYYRDVQYIWAVILQAGFFASGVFFDFSTYESDIKGLLLLNPMARIILISRESLLYNTAVSSWDLVFCFASSLVMLLVGYLIFMKLEPGFAEEV